MIDVSIIIVNYCTESLIIDCISSIINHTKNVLYEIIIVDNASPNNSFTILEKNYKGFDNIICHRIKENVGFGRANNEGYNLSSGRNVLCLNPDTELKNNAINILYNYLDEHKNVAVVGGNLFNKDGNMCTSFRRLYPSIFWEFNFMLNYIPERILFGKAHRFNPSKDIISVAYVTGADLMIKRSVIDEVGFFDPIFFMYYEDTELCFRVHKKGYDIKNIPQAEIFHYEGKSFKNLDRKAIFNYDSRENFYKIHYNKVYHFIADILFLMALIFRISALCCKSNTNFLYWRTLLDLLTKKYFLL